MKNFNYVDDAWHRPRLTDGDIPEEFVRWWRTVPHDRRHVYMHGGLYPMVSAFKEGQRVEAERLKQHVERLSEVLCLMFPQRKGGRSDASVDVRTIETAIQQIYSALRMDAK